MAAMACSFAALKYMAENGLTPKYNTVFAFSFYEEIGLGGIFVPAEISEYVAMDIAILGPDSEGFAWKPAPDGILRLMERHGMTREDTVMIGDRDCDLGSARNAGIRTAHLICPAVPQDLRCDWRLEDLRQLLTLI